MLVRLFFAVLLACAWVIAPAGQQCALSDGDTYVALPKDAPMPALGAIQIKKGEVYEVGPLMSGWIGVQEKNEFAWARATMFAYSCASASGGAVKGGIAPRPTHRGNDPQPSQSALGCPCGGGRVCVGPRGGRYCITSGGNKRYGQ